MKKSNVGKLALAGVLAAVTFLLGLTPIGIIPIPPANVTLMCLPVIIGTLTTSLGLGMVLGLVFGITSVIRAFTAPSVLVVPLLGASPALVVVMSVVSRLLILWRPIMCINGSRAMGNGKKLPWEWRRRPVRSSIRFFIWG